MTDLIDLAIEAGGYTSLDRAYLTQLLKGLTREEALRVITPPPSVVNAYFAELYQKRSPEAATAYFQELSRQFHLFTSQPSFEERYPFIRLNLDGRSCGFCYADETGRALVFTEDMEALSPAELLSLAGIFPHLLVEEREGNYWLFPKDQLVWPEEAAAVITHDQALLTDISCQPDGRVRLMGYNKEELLDLATAYEGRKVYGFWQRQGLVYVLPK